MADSRKSESELGEALVLLTHDLKNPLAAVLTNLGFVAGSLEDDDAREALVDAKLACESLQRLIANLELVARETAGRVSLLPIDPTPLDLASIVDDVVLRQREQANGRRLRIDWEGGKPVYARAERDLVLRAVENLVANAIQCAPAGSAIGIDVSASGAETRITIRDSGPVVPASLREGLLTPGGQAASKGRPEARYGRGLGLFAADIAARAGGGRIEMGGDGGRSALAIVLPRHEE
jgi:signal transduction histidine kinase